MSDHEKLIERFAREIINAMPYDCETGNAVCSNMYEAIRAVKEAIKKAHVRIEAGQEFQVLSI